MPAKSCKSKETGIPKACHLSACNGLSGLWVNSSSATRCVVASGDELFVSVAKPLPRQAWRRGVSVSDPENAPKGEG